MLHRNFIALLVAGILFVPAGAWGQVVEEENGEGIQSAKRTPTGGQMPDLAQAARAQSARTRAAGLAT